MLQLVLWSPRLPAQKVIDGRSVPAQWIVWRHKPTEPELSQTFPGVGDDAVCVLLRVACWNRTTDWWLFPALPVLLVVDEAEHEQPLLDEPLPSGVLRLQVPIVVVGHDHPVRLEGHLDDVTVVVANDPFAVDGARRRVDQDLLLLQLVQDVLVCRDTLAVSMPVMVDYV